MNDNDTPAWLRSHLQALPGDIPPARDLWPEIARRLDRPAMSRWMPAAVAASVIISVTATWFSWQVFEQSRRDAGALLAAQQLLLEIREPYLPVQEQYAAQWPAFRAQLDPETAAVVERNLEIIHNANAELARALERQPDSPVLQQLLRRTMEQELGLYRRVAAAVRPPI